MTTKPKCPNHAVEMDKTNERHIWICPISGAQFEVEINDEDQEQKKDKWGNLSPDYKLTQIGGTGG